MDERSRTRVLLAASYLTSRDDREAGIIGGLVRSLCASGYFSPTAVGAHARQLAEEMCSESGDRVKVGEVSFEEIRQVVARYQAAYKTIGAG